MTTTKAILAHALNTRDSFFYEEYSSIYNKDQALEAFKTGGYQEVGQFDIDINVDTIRQLEDIYTRTQNITLPWRGSDNPCRSTSIGGIVAIGECLYIVASCGFERIKNGLVTIPNVL